MSLDNTIMASIKSEHLVQYRVANCDTTYADRYAVLKTHREPNLAVIKYLCASLCLIIYKY